MACKINSVEEIYTNADFESPFTIPGKVYDAIIYQCHASSLDLQNPGEDSCILSKPQRKVIKKTEPRRSCNPCAADEHKTKEANINQV